MDERTSKARDKFKKIGLTFSTALITTEIAQITVFTLLLIFSPSLLNSQWNIAFLIGIPFYLVFVPVFLIMIRGVSNSPKGEKKKLTWKELLTLLFITMGSMYLFNLLGQAVALFIKLLTGITPTNPAEAFIGLEKILPTLIFVVILAPIAEEILFRKVLLDKVREYGQTTAIFFTAIVFSLFHRDLYQLFYTFPVGLIFGYIAYKTHSIKYTVVLHMIINLLGSIVMPALVMSQERLLMITAYVIVLGFIIIGSVLIFKNIKYMRVEEEVEYSPKHKVVYGNGGMILFYTICILYIAATFIAEKTL